MKFAAKSLAQAVAAGALMLEISAGSAAAGSLGLPYDPAAYELAPQFVTNPSPWHKTDLQDAILARAATEKQRCELDVDYYRIGHVLAFPLPVSHRPLKTNLPPGIDGMSYPWMIWLSWDLEDRWRVLHAAWRTYDDKEAGALLQQELGALSGWDHFYETYGDVGLVTAHFAAGLSLALADTSGWDKDSLQKAREASNLMIERDVWPWFQKTWQKGEITQGRLGNIPVIALVRAAQLASVVGHPRSEALNTRSREVLRAWFRFRTGPEHHTEGACYDGYLMDSITEWLQGQPDRDALLREGDAAFRSQAEQWIQLTLPGRADLHVPIGDDEPEMTQWASALMRLTAWYKWPDSAWLLDRFQISRMRAAALVAALDLNIASLKTHAPETGPHELPNAITLRTGWEGKDLLAVAGLSRGPMGHLQADTGQLILAWDGRCWIADPGYQQYRAGEERDYTLGTLAHNAPVIGGTTQTLKAARLLGMEAEANGRQHVRLDLSACYKGLPKGATIQRDIWLLPEAGPVVAVRDSFTSLTRNAQVGTSWLGGTRLAWSFGDGWARLSDGKHALWLGCFPGAFEAAKLTRHPGTRGPLALTHTNGLPEGTGVHWWVFARTNDCRSKPPSVTTGATGLLLTDTDTSQSWTLPGN